MERRLIKMGFFAGPVTAMLAIAVAPTPAPSQGQARNCGVFGAPACLTLAQVGIGQSKQLLLGTRPFPNAKKPNGPLNTLDDLWAALRACWRPPPLRSAHPGMQMTMRFSFKRDGNLLGPPQVTYATPEVSRQTREIYRDALAQSLQNCTPLPFTSGLGGAIAGRPISVLITDDRDDSPIRPKV